MTKELTLNKIAAALVGVAMVAGVAFAFSITRAHAVTLAELVDLFIAMDVIPADKAAEARSVVAQAGTETPAAPAAVAATCNFTRNLKVGATGADVMDLQKVLNAKGYTVAATGVGSAGMETQYYGPATAAAVSKMQEAFASEILAPLGLTKGTGIFGAATRAKANTLCTPMTPTTPTVPTVPGEEEEEEDTTLSGGEASLGDFKRSSSPSAATVAEGNEETEVAGFEFDVDDADASLKRVDVRFEATGGTANYSKKPYDYFDAVQLFVNGEMVDEVDAGSKSDWDDLAGDAWEVKFTGLDEVMSADETAKITIGVTAKSSLETEDENTTWNVWIPDNGIRARDGENLDQYVGDKDTLASADFERTFKTEGAGEGEELKVSLSSSNPKASVIKVKEDTSTDDVTVLVFELKAEEHDIEITELPVLFTIGSDVFDDVVSGVKLDIGGDMYDDYTTTGGSGAAATTTFEFDSGDVVIPEGEKVTVKVIVDLNKLTGNFEQSDTIQASLRDSEVNAIDAEGANTIEDADLTGTAIGETHTLQSQGIFAEIVSIDETKTTGDNNANDVGDYKIKFDVSAFDDTFYVSATTSSVFVYHIEDGNGTTVSTSSTSAITSTATKEGSAYRIDDGDKETFTLTVTLNPQVSGYYRVELDSITFSADAATPYGSSHTASPDEDFESDNLYLNA